MFDIDASPLEKFYAYKSLHSDESWGAMLAIAGLYKLPNVSFGMMVYAINEKEAISKARVLYERIHKWDSDKDNVRRFVTAALNEMLQTYKEKHPDMPLDQWEYHLIGDMAVRSAVETNQSFVKHFDKLEEEFNANFKPIQEE